MRTPSKQAKAAGPSCCGAGGACHFIIPAPDGRTKLPGVCKKCGREKLHSPFDYWTVVSRKGDVDGLSARNGLAGKVAAR